MGLAASGLADWGYLEVFVRFQEGSASGDGDFPCSGLAMVSWGLGGFEVVSGSRDGDPSTLDPKPSTLNLKPLNPKP